MAAIALGHLVGASASEGTKVAIWYAGKRAPRCFSRGSWPTALSA